MKRLGVVGVMVWDLIHGRDPARGPVEEWGGIAYSLAALDASLGPDWQIVPLVKVGRDLADRAQTFLRTLRRTTPDARFVLVPDNNNRVTLRYLSAVRRCEQMSGGVPPWTWPELGPMVADLDALYVNFISGFEFDLATARLLRQGFDRTIYADLHSLLLGKEPDGMRVFQPLPDPRGWFSCFDYLQVNTMEMEQLGTDPLAVAAAALGAGCRALCLTLGPDGAVAFTGSPARPLRVPPADPGLAPGDPGDPTGCGDVFGAVTFARLLDGAALPDALREGARLAARNVSCRGASGLRDHLLGRLTVA